MNKQTIDFKLRSKYQNNKTFFNRFLMNTFQRVFLDDIKYFSFLDLNNNIDLRFHSPIFCKRFKK